MPRMGPGNMGPMPPNSSAPVPNIRPMLNHTPPGAMPPSGQPVVPGSDWRVQVTGDLREHLVHKLVTTIFPTPDANVLRDKRMANLVAYAKKVHTIFYLALLIVMHFPLTADLGLSHAIDRAG